MEELLNSFELPNEIGFKIDGKTMKELFDSQKSFNNFINKVRNNGIRIMKNYGINDSLDFLIPLDFSVLSCNGKKIIGIDKYYIINYIYNYFNDYEEYDGTLYLNQNKDKEIEYYQEIQLLKEFLSQKIKALESVKKLEDLKLISKKLYESYLKAYNEVFDGKSILYQWDICFPQELKKDIIVFKKIKIWLKEFVEDLSNITLDKELFCDINQDKFKLYLSIQYLSLALYMKEPNQSLLIFNAKKILESIVDKNTKIKSCFILTLNDDLIFEWSYIYSLDYDKIKELLEQSINYGEKENIIGILDKIMIPEYNFDFDNYLSNILDLIDNITKKCANIGFFDESLDQMKNDANEKLKKEQSIEKQNQLKSYINRIDFYIKEMNPFKVQKGSGLFKGAHILFYENGNVAIDRLNGQYGYLYVMPINTYIEIIKNNEISNLAQIRNIITVKAISHKKDNWKEEAKNYIKFHSITKEEFEILSSLSGIVMPVNEQDLLLAKEKYKGNEYLLSQIREKEEEQKRIYEEIDKELRSRDYSDYDEKKDEDDPSLKDAETELLNNENITTSDEIEIKSKIKRSVQVSLDTKRRTCGPHGGMICEMCGEVESFSTRDFESHHIIPISQGGIDNVYNTVCLCGNCHNKIHSEIPFRMEEMNVMLKNVRKNLISSTPYYVEKFDRLFNPNYNMIYHNTDGLTQEELIELYNKEKEYYESHKEEEDRKFLTEWNSFKK